MGLSGSLVGDNGEQRRQLLLEQQTATNSSSMSLPACLSGRIRCRLGGRAGGRVLSSVSGTASVCHLLI